MHKKQFWIIGVIVGVAVVCAAAITAIVVVYNRNSGQNSSQSEAADNNVEEEDKDMAKVGDKTLVVYYSAQNHTEAVAKQIAENLGADIFEVVPKDVYTAEDLDWTDSNSRVSREHDNESLRDIELETTYRC